MLCELCNSTTRVVKTKEVSAGYVVTRTRECDGDPVHRYTTVESRPGGGLGLVAIRGSATNELLGMFDSTRLARDVENGVMKRMSRAQVRAAVDDALSELERIIRAQGKQVVDESERLRHPTAAYWIHDHSITEVVENQLEPRNRMALVLYALSIRGRSDRVGPGRDGWNSARDVLEWAAERFGYLKIDLRDPVGVQTEVWRRPTVDAPVPQWVIKRSRRDSVRGATRAFDYSQFVRSITKALAGRPGREATGDFIAQWVLWGLAGQPVILSSQLAVGVLDCLRRVDDIAYLRWSVIAKGTESVTEFASEARNLLIYPSPKLRFEDTRVAPRVAGSRADSLSEIDPELLSVEDLQ